MSKDNGKYFIYYDLKLKFSVNFIDIIIYLDYVTKELELSIDMDFDKSSEGEYIFYYNILYLIYKLMFYLIFFRIYYKRS